MTKKDWYEAGDQIKDLVQEAVESGDFSQLSNTVSHVVNEAMDSVGDALRESLKGKEAARRGNSGGEYSGRIRDEGVIGGDSYKNINIRVSRERQEAAERIRRNTGQRQRKEYKPVRKKLKAPGLILGRVMKWTGYTCSGIFGFTMVILASVGISTGISMLIPESILGVLFAGSMAMGIKGSRQEGIAIRFRRYTEVLGARTFCLIEELASAIGENSKFVSRDLKKMIRRGMFPQGYIDKKETCLITDHETYQQYLTTQAAYVARELSGEGAEQRKKPDRVRKEEEKETKDRNQTGDTGKETPERRMEKNPECRELLSEGQNYIRHIHACNDRIADQAISEKLDRLEMVVARIFTRAEREPEVADDLKKMMSYYLPTTKKLLDAYCELDEQPIRGQNIEATKAEIAATLDTLNTAFEKLLDDLFEEKAWDISSDISVLNTMLAQEGLTGNGFGAGKRTE